MTNQQAPSATDKMTDIQKEAITGFTNWKEGLSVYNTPSATVDDAVKYFIAQHCPSGEDDKRFFMDNLARLLHSQRDKRYTREDMIAFGQRMRSGSHYSDEYIGKQLDQFDKEGK